MTIQKPMAPRFLPGIETCERQPFKNNANARTFGFRDRSTVGAISLTLLARYLHKRNQYGTRIAARQLHVALNRPLEDRLFASIPGMRSPLNSSMRHLLRFYLKPHTQPIHPLWERGSRAMVRSRDRNFCRFTSLSDARSALLGKQSSQRPNTSLYDF
ncbi:hypothetical protein KR51_00035310 [Rubidibacter lacunae KORDI 51-2]|uniref:Uncharacterized protein n=1 Tax=Rubidibacter lacunae KORDI 51-2 TaxID=582515 RepID=U5D5I3_9CHRO|nr:hypothetical protein KR51_00035310 [Rubidibacter lacunae KORDI 51-2]